MTWQDFEKKYINKKTDVDKSFGAQCWDLFAAFERDNGIPITRCNTTGFVRDIWLNRNTNGVLKYFDEVKPSDIKEGDWVIWPSTYRLTPYSHIGMNVGKNQCFGQNQKPNDQTACVITLDMAKAYGGLRYKGWPKPIGIDGIVGKKTVTYLQKWLGAWEDGLIGGQDEKYKPNHPALTSVKYAPGGSNTVRALQKRLNSSGFPMGVDGQWGPKTSRNFQAFLTSKGFKVGSDGIFGTKSATQLQKFLNKELI